MKRYSWASIMGLGFTPPQYILDWVQVTPSITLNNVTQPNNLLLNSYFKIFTIELYVLYVLNMHTNINVNQLLFTIRSIISHFIHYFKLKIIEFKQLIDNITIDI